ncbi:MAG: porin family protein, partial [Pseudomonadota bacterium]
ATFSANGDRASDNADDEGYSAGIGVRSVVLGALELRGELAYFDVGELVDGWAYELGAYYTFADHFTVGASYLDYDDPETYRFTLRYQF